MRPKLTILIAAFAALSILGLALAQEAKLAPKPTPTPAARPQVRLQDLPFQDLLQVRSRIDRQIGEITSRMADLQQQFSQLQQSLQGQQQSLTEVDKELSTRMKDEKTSGTATAKRESKP